MGTGKYVIDHEDWATNNPPDWQDMGAGVVPHDTLR
jgi:hypothetical protein